MSAIKRIGLTGGIGSGKTTVASLFAKRGVTVIDSDAIAHELTASGGAAIAAIRAAFGDEYVTDEGALNRAGMRRLVFSDADAKRRLEAILHPMIRARTLALADAAEGAYVLLVVPLLFEQADFRELVQRALVVDCAEETQRARAMARNGLSESEVRAIMAAQISRAERLELADDVIVNDGGMDALDAKVASLHCFYMTLD
ncbi:MAG: dephospho-CoA kinase [Gallionellaceae bacterium]|jgi:dephospho-CoA kinase|nr:dephospho-CoA kinase [Gallionellaceae bacterium]